MDDLPYRCMLCGKHFKSPQAIDYHYDSWEHYEKFEDLLREKKYRCDLCFNRFETKLDFAMHVSVYHPRYSARTVLTNIYSGEEDWEEEANEDRNQQGGKNGDAAKNLGEHDEDDDGIMKRPGKG